jgi:hypothetical protein
LPAVDPKSDIQFNRYRITLLRKPTGLLLVLATRQGANGTRSLAKRRCQTKGAELISIVYNETLKAIEIHLDIKGADLPIQKLERLKSEEGHLHLYATNDDRGVSPQSPYQEKRCTANSF